MPPLTLARLHFAATATAATAAAPSKSPPLVVLHGVFGSKQNWQSLAKRFAKLLNTDVYALDLRNHGDSPHAPSMSLQDMADDVALFLDRERLSGGVTLMGHSMGGKVAMHLALQQPQTIRRLISVDMAPVNFKLSPVFSTYIAVMQRIEQAQVSKQSDADRLMQQYIPETAIRQFLLTNLKHFPGESSLRFRIPLAAIDAALPELHHFPLANTGATYAGPTLLVGAKRARYVTSDMTPQIHALFPAATITMLDTGHWVHSERPDVFVETVTDWLAKVKDAQ
ncbi:hypothetical protein RI367_003676 [Sorochytrium milnesiophthora]